MKVQQATRADTSAHNQILRDALIGLKKPIMRMSDHVSLVQDKFDSSFFLAFDLGQ